MEFEYDPEKSATNKAKHGIDFEEAKRLWDDDGGVTIEAKTKGEPRAAFIAMMDGKHWTAITTDRGDKTRIISVRRSHKNEEAVYDEKNNNN